MKRIIFSLSIAVILFSSCYPEGGSVSASDEHIKNSWQIQHAYLNGEEIKESVISANVPGTVYRISYGGDLEVSAYINGIYKQSFTGKWQLENKRKDLHLAFVLSDRSYHYIASVKYLSNSGLYYEYTDENSNKWRLELTAIYLF